MRYAQILGTGLVWLALASPALPQSPEVKVLQKEVEALKKDVAEIKALLQGQAPPKAPDQPISVEGAPFVGDRNAKVTLIEFSDYQCGFCARHILQTVPHLMSEYVKTGKVKYVVRDFPLDSMHRQAAKAAEAAHCANEQGKYWDMHQRLMTNQRTLAPEQLPSHAQALGLDAAKFKQCLDSGKYAARVRTGQEEGQKAGVDGTPSFFFGLTDNTTQRVKALNVLRGAYPYPQFKEALDGLLAGAAR